MKYTTFLTLSLATMIRALSILLPEQGLLQDSLEEKYLVEFRPGETRWVTEDEKWELRRVGLPISSYLMCTGGVRELNMHTLIYNNLIFIVMLLRAELIQRSKS